MNLTETDQLLTVIQNITGRKEPADDAMVIIWQQILGDLPYADCVQAVAAHFRDTTEYLLPAHIVAGVLKIRNERAAASPHAIEARALPSRFELDDVRDERIRRNLPELMAKWSVSTDDDGSDPHAAALARARRERKSKMPESRRRRDPNAKPIDLDKVTDGPEWAKAEIRERLAVAELHRNNRPCGRTACSRCVREEA